MGELETQRTFLGGQLGAAADARLDSWGGSAEVFRVLFDVRARTLASSLIGLFVPMFALLFALAYGWGRGARHLVLALHVVAVQIAFYVLLAAGLSAAILGLLAVGVGVPQQTSAAVKSAAVALVLTLTATYVALSARRVFRVGAARAWGGGALIAVVGLPTAMLAYRVALFWLTLWTLRLPAP